LRMVRESRTADKGQADGKAENTFACMKAAYDVGINFFDCAEGYSGGESERVMGEAIKKFNWKRNDLVVSTKVYCKCHAVLNIGLQRPDLLGRCEWKQSR
jgi:aryl-alcohol dehydrogenase-like predicted oxidoreductase